MSKSPDFYWRFGKRTFDIFASAIALGVLSPLFLVVALLVRITSEGPVIYFQERVGMGGRLFRIAKFRSMQKNAEKMGSAITSGRDVRVTKVGKLLRLSKIDELPQLWNVLKGEMSFVGPRPELPQYVCHYSSRQLEVLTVRPGITDLASIRYMREEDLLGACPEPWQFYANVILPHKLELNLEYLRRASFSYDLLLLSRTLVSICRCHSQVL